MTSKLLPNGLIDLLPELAEKEADAIHTLMSFFRTKDYRRVKPPLIEFEDTLLQGPGQATAPHMFRVMDPKSQKMMGLRADITPQIARIAATRIDQSAYPLKMSYAGDILHVKGSQLDPTRQMTQVGCELIGDDSVAADVECIMTAIQGLKELAHENITLDITLPALLRDILGDDDHSELFKALDNKNAEQIAEFGGDYKTFLLALLNMSGNLEDDIVALKKIDAPAKVQDDLDRLYGVIEGVNSHLNNNDISDVTITIDPTEHSFFSYHRGISFSLYLEGSRNVIARGGRYDFETEHGDQSAIGFTIYMNALRRFYKKAT